MLISELIADLEAFKAAKGDLPVALMMTRTGPFGDHEVDYASCEPGWLNVEDITFENNEYNANATIAERFNGRGWTKVPRTGPHLVIDAT